MQQESNSGWDVNQYATMTRTSVEKMSGEGIALERAVEVQEKTYVSILFAQVNQQEAKGSLGLSRMAKE